MNRKILTTILGVLLAATALAPEVRPQARRGQAASAELCPDQKVYTGRYRNRHYGFSVVIPAGLKGYWNSPGCARADEGCVCMTDHGRIMPLSDGAHIEAYTAYEMFEWSASDYERDELADLKKRPGVGGLKVLSSKGMRLGTLRARRFAVRFVEKNRDVVRELVVAVHEGVEYKLILHTPAERYQKDRREFEKVVASWRLTRRTR